MVECISGTGVTLNPLIIFKGKSVQQQWFPTEKGPWEDWKFHATDNGWITDDTALFWLSEVFIPAVCPVRKDARKEAKLLILDGHGSHVTPEFMAACLDNNIYLLYLPPHTSHVLQPLDLAIFSPLKTAYRSQVDHHLQFTTSSVIGKRHFIRCYFVARTAAFTASNMRAAWKGTGLWPVNMAKPLLSPLLLENSNKQGRSIPTGLSESQKALQKSLEKETRESLINWSTPKRGQDAGLQLHQLAQLIEAPPTARLLFRKVTKALDIQSIEIASLKIKTRQQEAQLEELRPVKRKRVHPDPNQKFVTMRDVRRARSGSAEEEAPGSDSPSSDESEDTQDCIVVACE
ncbi:hypothetical protein RB600_009104 [Gaeumannomyces tritici]